MPAFDNDFWRSYKENNPIIEAPSMTMTQTGLINAVRMQENRNGFQQLGFSETNGNKKIAKFKYKQRVLESEIKTEAADGEPNYCEGTRTPTRLQAEQEITQRVYDQFFIPYETVRRYDESLEQEFNIQIELMLDAMLRKINGNMINSYEAVRGEFADGTTARKDFQGFSSLATYTVNHAFVQNMKNEFRALQHTGRVIAVGDTLPTSFMRALMYGTENNTRGQVNNLSLLNDVSYMDDTMLDATLGSSDNFLAWTPGSFQFLEWFQNVGEYRFNSEEHIRDTITLNLNGMQMAFDIVIHTTYCKDSTTGWHVTISKWYDTWAYPGDIYATGDPLDGTNGMLRMGLVGQS